MNGYLTRVLPCRKTRYEPKTLILPIQGVVSAAEAVPGGRSQISHISKVPNLFIIENIIMLLRIENLYQATVRLHVTKNYDNLHGYFL